MRIGSSKHCVVCTTKKDLKECTLNGKAYMKCDICAKLGRQLPIGRR